ncbi:oxidoreductase [Chitinophaga sp. GCM10012297]|uniref:SDR family NAD(P)-dependent oxidoreductase n=1 Tax=Chitinophaga chungangae TaxID=2821488 RepID=A0ABS3Y9V5_9BACT|nr:oxidoreductase [Chitinophaga chungangae]MBO9151270.1 SDR family NAD(P)-dependent oxidoreductase [Chitinophaga chungangae]
MTQVWFITGSSRGLGRSITAAALEAGHKVAATARNTAQLQDLEEKYPGQILPLRLDVSDAGQVRRAVADAVAHFGRLDVVVNNAGFGITGATEGYTDEQVRSQIETNLYGPIEVSRAVLPYLRKQRSGRILQVSSIGGRFGNAGLSIYHATKFAVAGFSEALAKEVAHLGIHVTSVEPGGFRTDWAGSSMTFAPGVEGYETNIGVIEEILSSGKFKPMGDPDKAAKAIVDLASHPSPPVHLVFGSEAVALLEQANAARDAEAAAWKHVSVSTDADDAENFFESEANALVSRAKGM